MTVAHFCHDYAVHTWGADEPTPGRILPTHVDFIGAERTLHGDQNWWAPVRAADGNAQEGEGGVPNCEEETGWAVSGTLTLEEE